MWAGGECFQQPTPALGTSANVGGFVPTPRANDAQKRGMVDPNDPRNGLVGYVRRFPTPNVAMAKGSSAGALTRKSGRSRENDRLDYAVEGDGKNGRLNPMWVEWLMGWPSGWTALKPLATAKFREWLHTHGNS
jgi:DNA (cytosine-5)-methyltransferase 1